MNIIEAIRTKTRPKEQSAVSLKDIRRAKELGLRAEQQMKVILESLLPKLKIAPGQKMQIDQIDEKVLATQLYKHLAQREITRDNLLNWKNYEGKKAGRDRLMVKVERQLASLIANTAGVENYLDHADKAAEKIIVFWIDEKAGRLNWRQRNWQSRTALAYHLSQMRLIRTGQ